MGCGQFKRDFFLLQINIDLMFLYHFNVLMLKINFFKIKKIYFNIFLNKKYFKNHHYTFKYTIAFAAQGRPPGMGGLVRDRMGKLDARLGLQVITSKEQSCGLLDG